MAVGHCGGSPKEMTRDRRKGRPPQAGMFASCDVVPLEVKARPRLSLAARPQLELASEDRRTPIEPKRDAQREADEKTTH